MSLKHMKASIKDPKLQQQLTPTYSLGCKRILVSDDYYAALSQPNVKLVTSGLKQVHVTSFGSAWGVTHSLACWHGMGGRGVVLGWDEMRWDGVALRGVA